MVRSPANRAAFSIDTVTVAAPSCSAICGGSTARTRSGPSSSSAMAPSPEPSASVALRALPSSTVKVSPSSQPVSSSTVTPTVFAVSPGAKVRVPEAAT